MTAWSDTPGATGQRADDSSGTDSIYDADTLADLSRRLEKFSRTEDPAALWPGLNDAERVGAALEIERVTRVVLGGSSSVGLDPQCVHSAYALAIAGHTTGIGPLLGRWIEDGVVSATPSVAKRFTEHLRHARLRAARIEREVLPAIDAMIARDLRPVMLKGFHTARRYFEEPAVRRMSDVDVLIPDDRERVAAAALEGAGFRVATRTTPTHKRDWIGPGVEDRVFSVELSDARTRWTLELHTSLDRRVEAGSVARLDAEREHLDWTELAGRRLAVLAPAPLLVVLACHCSEELGSSRLLRLVEIVRVIRTERAAGRLDWDEVLAILDRSGAARFAYPALTLAENLAPGTVDARALSLGERRSTWAAKHTTARLAPSGGSLDARGLIRQFMWTRGPRGLLQRFLRKVRPVSDRPQDVASRLRADVRRLRAGVLTLRAPDERNR